MEVVLRGADRLKIVKTAISLAVSCIVALHHLSESSREQNNAILFVTIIL
jgi:predicted lysophospholipase L1 biosynthesis ABC-type transport system permease subunit